METVFRTKNEKLSNDKIPSNDFHTVFWHELQVT